MSDSQKWVIYTFNRKLTYLDPQVYHVAGMRIDMIEIWCSEYKGGLR